MKSRDDLPALGDMDVSGRADRLRHELVEAEVDALIVTKPANIRWLTGFTGSSGLVLVTPERLLAVTDGRYRTQVGDELAAAGVTAEVEITVTEVGSVLGAAVAAGDRVGLEARHVTWERRDQFESWLHGRTLVPTSNTVEELRKLKDHGERSRLIRAAAIADVALGELSPLLADGLTERAVARRLEELMLDLGADEPSYATIVAAGPNSALPHAKPTERVIRPDDLVVIDVGARLDGYGSDMTRTFVAGGEPTGEQQRWYDAVVEAQAAGVAAVRDGASERSIDTTCRAALAAHGLEHAFIHGTGHGIGLEIHEDPILSPRSEGILRAGLVVTVEPGVYLAGRGGVRVEDSVIVGADGCESITHSPKCLVPVTGATSSQ